MAGCPAKLAVVSSRIQALVWTTLWVLALCEIEFTAAIMGLNKCNLVYAMVANVSSKRGWQTEGCIEVKPRFRPPL